jgi:HlyD family secretion protein
MRNKILIALAVIGILAGFVSAYVYNKKPTPQPPAFTPAPNPYDKGIYANGIVESTQASGENVNIYPEVPGPVVKIAVAEGQQVKAGEPLLMLDDSVQRATTEQLKAAAESANEQINLARANLKTAQDTLEKVKKSYELDPKSVSRDTLDTAQNVAETGRENVAVAEKQYAAALKSYQTASVLLSKYVVHAPANGVVLSINTAVGSYISAQGSYDSYTTSYMPPIVMGSNQDYLAVRCYIDEILIQRLPKPEKMKATMFIRGNTTSIPLEFVRAQPNVSPKIELSNQRLERVDVRVLPLIFKFSKPKGMALYPGQLVDVYIGDE